jgi:hypothetical protein
MHLIVPTTLPLSNVSSVRGEETSYKSSYNDLHCGQCYAKSPLRRFVIYATARWLEPFTLDNNNRACRFCLVVNCLKKVGR